MCANINRNHCVPSSLLLRVSPYLLPSFPASQLLHHSRLHRPGNTAAQACLVGRVYGCGCVQLSCLRLPFCRVTMHTPVFHMRCATANAMRHTLLYSGFETRSGPIAQGAGTKLQLKSRLCAVLNKRGAMFEFAIAGSFSNPFVPCVFWPECSRVPRWLRPCSKK